MNEASNKPFREGFQPVENLEPEEAASAPAPVPEAPKPEFEQESWPITVRLRKPVRNMKGDMLRELVFREPTGGDINRYGNPVRIDQNGDVVIDEKKMSMMMSSLAGILLPFLEQMDPRDWNSCAYRLRNFFLPDPSAW